MPLSGTAPEGEIVYNVDHKLLQYCDGINWIPMHQAGSGTGGCEITPLGLNRSEGAIFFNADYRTLQVCAGNVWRAMGPVLSGGGDACESGPIGTVCADGAVYAGDTVGGARMYVADADESGTFQWKTTNTETASTTSNSDGLANTNAMETAGIADHPAGGACRTRGADWYFPAIDELGVIYGNRTQLGAANLPTSGSLYWSSSANHSLSARNFRFDDGTQNVYTKVNSIRVRCVRRAISVSLNGCTGPERPQGGMIYNRDYRAMQYCDGAEWVPIGKTVLTLRDDTPDALGLNDQTGVALSTLTESNIVTISGVESSVSVSITGDGTPEFRIDGGSWATSGTIAGGQTLQLRLISSATNSTTYSATVTVGTESSQWNVTTEDDPSCPVTPAPGDEGCEMPDGTIYVGISPDGNVAMYTTPVDLGQYPWNNGNGSGTYTTTNQSNNLTGQSNTANLIFIDSDSGAGGTQPHQAPQACANLIVHGHNDWYLPSRDELNLLWVMVNTGVTAGLNTSGSSYWSSSENASATAKTQEFSGGAQNVAFKDYDRLTRCVRKDGDITPDVFAFTDQTGVATSGLVSSNTVTITGIAGSVPVSISGDGSPEFRIAGGSWTSGPAAITNGQTLQLRLTSASAFSTMRSATVTVGTESDQWDVTTAVQDTTPNAFTFTDQTGVALNTLISSNTVTINGITGSVSVSISGAGSPQFRIAGGSWVTSGNITNGQSLQLRLTSANSGTTMRSATVTVGTVSDQWDVTTEDPGPCGGIGGLCPDGTYYAGLSPDGNVPMYVAASDEAAGLQWSSMTLTTDVTNTITGEANTSELAAYGQSTHPAAYECQNKSAHGHTDWYLPAEEELNVLWNMVSNHYNPGFTTLYYWSSTEYISGQARAKSFSNGAWFNSTKVSVTTRTRCVRR